MSSNTKTIKENEGAFSDRIGMFKAGNIRVNLNNDVLFKIAINEVNLLYSNNLKNTQIK